jgi:hypothetical protein
MTDNLANEVDVLASIPVNKNGTFSFKGKGTLLGDPALGSRSHSLPVTISGRFVTPELATVKLAITYKGCRPVNLTLRYPGP